MSKMSELVLVVASLLTPIQWTRMQVLFHSIGRAIYPLTGLSSASSTNWLNTRTMVWLWLILILRFRLVARFVPAAVLHPIMRCMRLKGGFLVTRFISIGATLGEGQCDIRAINESLSIPCGPQLWARPGSIKLYSPIESNRTTKHL